MKTLPEALQPLADHAQFILYKLTPSAKKPGKFDKFPVDHRTLQVFAKGSDWQNDRAAWTDADNALRLAALCGDGYGVGFFFTADDGLFFLDIDDCLQLDNTWSKLAIDLLALLPGAAVEVSSSGRGLHVFGRMPEALPHSSRNDALGLELYTERRFVALTGTGAYGSAAVTCDRFGELVAQYFPTIKKGRSAEWTDGPVADWSGHTDDDALIEQAIGSKSAGGAFGASASFADLWAGDADALAKAYPDGSGHNGSQADAALAQHLAFWTGNDCERMLQLMWRSGLVRDKWDREDYLHRTILNAVSMQETFYQRQPAAPQVPAETTAAASNKVTREFDRTPETNMVLGNRKTRLIRFNGTWLTHEAGSHYRELEEEALRAEVRQNCGFSITPTKVNAVLDELKAAALVDAYNVTLPHWINRAGDAPPASNLIVCKNGVLDPVEGRLYPHSDDLLTFNALPFAYDPRAPRPARWGQFLNEVFGDDPEAIGELQKLFAYFLTLDTSQQKIFALIGPKRSGKGTIARTLRELIGPLNVASPSFSSMGRPFGLESLIGKQLAIFPDARIGRTTDKTAVAERLLSISGEDAIAIERKHKSDWHGKIGARLLILSNELPVFGDASGALASRYVVINTPHSFYGREDTRLTDKLTAELPGILNWALEGLHKLEAGERIVTPASARDLAEEMDHLGSPVKHFVHDCCTLEAGGKVGKQELWAAYQNWHIAEGIPSHPLSNGVFARQLKAAYPMPKVDDYRERLPDDKRVWVWTGIRLNDPMPISSAARAFTRP